VKATELVISGEVVKGDQRGRELGFPTANVRLPDADGAPAFGIYCGLVDGRPAAISVGVRPTFGDGLEPLLEAHILDFSGDLYGRTVEVRLLERIRGERAFADVDELVVEMHRDVRRVRELLARRAGSPVRPPSRTEPG
jgi:riboflavin kinase / FMN adenylyltransferase